MSRNRISDDARQVVFNVLLYFEQEAYRFKKQENGYFQKVHARVTKACCVSRKFINTLIKEEKFYGNYTPQPIGKGRRLKICDAQEFGPNRLIATHPSVVHSGPPPPPTPFLTPAIPPVGSFYSKVDPPPLVPIVKRFQSPTEPPKPIAETLDELLPPIVNSFDALLPPVINNLGTLPPMSPMVKLTNSSSDLSLLGTSPDASPYRYTPELLIDEDREINYSDNEDIGPMPYDPLCFGFSDKMIHEFGDDGEIG